MFFNSISKFINRKKMNCLLVTPPLLETNTIYPAMPILAGQLQEHGYNTKNLDLNIKFFRKILTKEYIKNTVKILEKERISVNYEEMNFLLNNIENAISVYKLNQADENANNIIHRTLNFIVSPYSGFKIERLGSFENCFSCGYTYEEIKEITNNRKKNIFINIFEDEVKAIKQSKINFIAITIPFIGALIPALTLSQIIKKETNIFVTLGGNFLSKDDVINHSELLDLYCDCVLTGDGEESIIKLVQAVEHNETKENVSGLIYKDKNKKIFCNKPEPVTKLKNIVPASFEGIDFDDYLINNPSIYVMMSKGCYWGKCTFCSLAEKYDKYCTKTPTQAVKEIKELKERYNIKGHFLLQDDSIPPAFLSKFADEIFKENLDICYAIFARFEKAFTKELFEKLYKSGLRGIYWGLESGCQKILNEMNKGIQIEDVPDILKNSHDTGISNMAGIIVNFPTETIEDFNETIKFIETVKDYVTISPGNFSVMKNSIIDKNCKDYGIKILQRNEFSYCPSWENVNIPQDIIDKKWSAFVEYTKTGKYDIDSNKNF